MYPNTKIITYSGKLVDVFNLKPGDIDLKHIAHSLAIKSRFNGSSASPYSVAQHCCLCATHAKPPLLPVIALLHDASEAYFLDIPGPWKQDEMFKPLVELEAVIQEMIFDKYISDWPIVADLPSANYHHTDHQMLINECRCLLPAWTKLSLANEFVDAVIDITPWTWQESERQWLNIARVLEVHD